MSYRLDYVDATGNVIEPVGVATYQHMMTARRHATQAAAERQADVLVSRVGASGQPKATLVIQPDGTSKRPPSTRGTRGSDCTRTDGGPACFCHRCRADRRAARTRK